MFKSLVLGALAAISLVGCSAPSVPVPVVEAPVVVESVTPEPVVVPVPEPVAEAPINEMPAPTVEECAQMHIMFLEMGVFGDALAARLEGAGCDAEYQDAVVELGKVDNSERSFSCTYATDDTKICEGDVPESEQPFLYPEEYTAGS